MKIKISKNSILGFDLFIFFAVEFLMIIGIFFIYSSGVNSDGISVSNEYIKQIIWVSTGTIIMLVVSFVDYKIFKTMAVPLYGISILLLILTLLFGRVVNGAKSWFGWGALGIQPSELAKLSTILTLALFFESKEHEKERLKTFLQGSIIAFIPMALILLQPDLGTGMVFIPILLVMAFLNGTRLRYIVVILATGFFLVLFTMLPYWEMFILKKDVALFSIFSDPFLFKIIFLSLTFIILFSLVSFLLTHHSAFLGVFYSFLSVNIAYGLSYLARSVIKGYQMMRLIVFLDPQVDPKGAGWNIIQSVTAVGSGGLFGKGYLKGTQSHYRYLPEQSTDFIFSIISEEIGFIGVLFIILLFTIILLRGLNIALKSQDIFGSMIASGIVGMIFFHFLVNIGMAIGIMPITGIPLLFISYGGSSLWSTLFGIGLTLSVYHRRYKNTN